MTSIITIIFIIFIFSWIYIKSSKKSSNNGIFLESNEEDHNYQALKKLFFAVNGNNINATYLTESNLVYGILIEAQPNDKKILFACYITGFAGYYQSKGGGLIGGELYPENDQNVQQELMKLCNNKNLNGENQTKETRKMAIKMTMRANEFLSKAILKNSWSDDRNTIKFWFLTKEGIYFAEEQNSLIDNSIWKVLVDEGFCIIKALNKV